MSARLAVERLCALISPDRICKPHVNTIHYYGIFAPSAAWRAQIVPGGEQHRALRRKQKEKAALGQVVSPDASRWTPWLVLLARVFGADLGRCPGCGASCWADDLVLGEGRSKRELLLLGVRREALCCEASQAPPDVGPGDGSGLPKAVDQTEDQRYDSFVTDTDPAW